MIVTQHNNIRVVDHQKKVIVLDIDGCLVDSFDRLPHLLQGDRDAYDALHPTDRTIPAGAEIYKLLCMSDHEILFITSRSDCARTYTENQLMQALGPAVMATKLLMRPAGCDEPDVILKPRLLEEAGYRPEDVLLVVEDSAVMNEYWRSLGITCWQTLPNAV
jgi:hypothetical protein